jgi:hypothetical protein
MAMSPTSSCPTEPQLRQFALGLSPEAEVEWLGQHLTRCPHCLELLSQLPTDDDLLGVLARVQRDRPHLGDEFEERRRHLAGLRPRGPDTSTGSDPAVIDTPPPPTRTPSPCPDLNELLAPAEEPDELGRLGPYAVIELLGTGGMGAVFRARQ